MFHLSLKVEFEVVVKSCRMLNTGGPKVHIVQCVCILWIFLMFYIQVTYRFVMYVCIN